MRVLVVPKWYPWPDRPVFGSFCREHARAIAAQHEIVVLASDAVRSPRFAAFELTDAVEDGLRTLRLRYRRPWLRPASMGIQLSGMLVALRKLRAEGWRPEIVHAHVYSAGLPALVLGRVSGAPVVISEHFTGFQRGLISGYDRFTARIAFRGADLVAPVSHDLARHVQALAPGARVRVVENVVDTDVFHAVFRTPTRPRDGIGDEPARLLTVAALTEKKGHADLFQALLLLRERGVAVRLDLVGDGELRSQLQALVGQLRLSEEVRFHGELPKQEVASFMRAADLFVLPSRFENLPCVLIEAMASGLPSLATAVGGVPELLDGAGLTLSPARDPPALAASIERALRDRAGVDPGALSARARTRFGYAAIGRTWTGIYEELRSSAGATSFVTIRRTVSGR